MINKQLLLKMADDMEADPESYDQGTPGQSYCSRVAEERYGFGDYGSRPRPRPAPACGSVACLMGQAVISSSKTRLAGIRCMDRILSRGDIVRVAMKLTGLPDRRLFSATSHDWPEPYRSAWANAKTYKGQTRAAVRMLRAIARTDGKILE